MTIDTRFVTKPYETKDYRHINYREFLLAPLVPQQDKVRPQDLAGVLMSLTRCSPTSRERVWQFIQDQWPMLRERYNGQFLLARIIDVSGGIFSCRLSIFWDL